MVRMHVPGIFQQNGQVEREFQDIWQKGCERASIILQDTCLQMASLKLDLLNAQQDGSLQRLQTLLKDDEPQWQRVKGILDSLLAQHHTSSTKKYDGMLDHLKQKRPPGTPFPPPISKRKRDFPNMRTQQTNQGQRAPRGPPPPRRGPKTNKSSRPRPQYQSPTHWRQPQMGPNPAFNQMGHMLGQMFGQMMGQFQGPHTSQGRASSRPPPKKARRTPQGQH